MLQRLKRALKVALNLERGRQLTVFEDDIFLVSYPKSGNTWTKFLVANLYDRKHATTFSSIDRVIPDIYMSTGKALENMARPRILKSHECFDPRYKKVIYIVRDPRDVSLSYYHHWIKFYGLADDYPLDKFIVRFIRGELDPYGSWGENVGSWLGARQQDDNFLLIRYEDLLEHTERELAKTAAFLSWTVSQADIGKAIMLCSPDNMRRLEQDESQAVRFLKKSRADKFFVRNAKAGAWRTELSSQTAGAIQSAWGKLMQDLNYL